MRRIYKFALHPDVQEFSGLVRLLGVGWQGDNLRLWAEYDDEEPHTTQIIVALTGQAPPMDCEFLGTAVGREFVAHVYVRHPSHSLTLQSPISTEIPESPIDTYAEI